MYWSSQAGQSRKTRTAFGLSGTASGVSARGVAPRQQRGRQYVEHPWETQSISTPRDMSDTGNGERVTSQRLTRTIGARTRMSFARTGRGLYVHRVVQRPRPARRACDATPRCPRHGGAPRGSAHGERPCVAERFAVARRQKMSACHLQDHWYGPGNVVPTLRSSSGGGY